MTNQLTISNKFPNVAFGTSGVRALVSELSPDVLSAYTFAFIEHVKKKNCFRHKESIVLGMDLRPSSPFITSIISQTALKAGIKTEFAGTLPTPALALRCFQAKMPGIMVTGSHIPFDRNGIKFYLPEGEILKPDEDAISKTYIENNCTFNLSGEFKTLEFSPIAQENYIFRYLNYFNSTALQGMRIGLFEHSAVGRDLTRVILMRLGAEVISLERSDIFVPIDTEAVSQDTLTQTKKWCKTYALDAIISTDGDGDRPLVFDENGEFIRGDVLGVICARELDIHALAIPITCNTMIEKSGYFDKVLRTKIGSPFVISGMHALTADGHKSIAGFEANGGFLLGSALPELEALPTRDALLPIFAVLNAVNQTRAPFSNLIHQLPRRYTHSDRIKEISNLASLAMLTDLLNNPAAREAFFDNQANILNIDTTDGLRIYFADDQIIHLRASGNAPELRFYAEANSQAQAQLLVEKYIKRSLQNDSIRS